MVLCHYQKKLSSNFKKSSKTCLPSCEFHLRVSIRKRLLLPIPMYKKDVQELIQRKQIEKNLRAEFEATFKDRVDRYLMVKPHEIIPHNHFASVSTELSRLFRDGHYYGCIALSQAVGEALVGFMCERHGFKPAKSFEDNLEKLEKRGCLSSSMKSNLTLLWNGRDDYHHLNSSIEQNRSSLQVLAKSKAQLLLEMEREIFGYFVKEGAIIPHHPKYWDLNEHNLTQVFLRFE